MQHAVSKVLCGNGVVAEGGVVTLAHAKAAMPHPCCNCEERLLKAVDLNHGVIAELIRFPGAQEWCDSILADVS